MKLPKNIIAKYGISKKAWQVFRDTRGSSRTSNKRKGVNTMARKHRKGSKGSSMNDMLIVPIVGAGYGLVRQPIANAIPDFMGAYSDNIALGGGAAVASMFLKGTARKAALEILGIEAFIATSKVSVGVPASSNADAPTGY